MIGAHYQTSERMLLLEETAMELHRRIEVLERTVALLRGTLARLPDEGDAPTRYEHDVAPSAPR